MESHKTDLINQTQHHISFDPHARGSSLSDVILGGQDGLVNVLGVILGVAAATGNTSIVLVAGLAAAVAESVSMGAVAYTSTLADADYYESERAREYRHIKELPQLEKDEVRTDLRQKRDSRASCWIILLRRSPTNQDIWVAVMMAEEHQLTPVDRSGAWKVALDRGFFRDHWFAHPPRAVPVPAGAAQHDPLGGDHRGGIIWGRGL